MLTDKEIASFQTSDVGVATTFYISPRNDQYTTYDGSYYMKTSLMPSQLTIDAARLVTGRPASEQAYASKTLAGQRPPGRLYALGPVVDEIAYVVNGVRLQTRSDKGSVISMIGTVEVGSCPFVFVHRGGTAPLNIGTIIRDRVGREASGRDTIRIPSGTDRIELRELEDEVSHIDSATLIIVRDLQTLRIPAVNPLVSATDGRHAILRRGDRLWLDFGQLPQDEDQVWLEVTGFYEPVRNR
jgi:hypothetical protein